MSRLVDERYLTGGSPEYRDATWTEVFTDSEPVETFDDCPGLVPVDRHEQLTQELRTVAFSERVFVGAVVVLSCLAFLSLGAILVYCLDGRTPAVPVPVQEVEPGANVEPLPLSWEVYGFGDYAIWLDVWTPGSPLEYSGILFDFGPVYGGYFVEFVDIVSGLCFWFV